MYAQREQLGKEMDCLGDVIGVGFISGQVCFYSFGRYTYRLEGRLTPRVAVW